MATIRVYKGTAGPRYTATIRKPGLRSTSKTFHTRQQAERWARKVETAIDDKQVIGGQVYNVRDAIAEYKSEHPNLKKYDLSVLTWWDRELGKRPLHELNRPAVLEARHKLQQTLNKAGNPLAPATVNRRVARLSAVVTAAQNRGWVKDNYAKVSALPEGNEDVADEAVQLLMQPGTVKRLLAATSASGATCLDAFVQVAMASGARAGELQRLNWEDVDLEHGSARLMKTKSGKKRPIPIRGQALTALKALRDHPLRPISGHVFFNNTGSAPFNYRLSWGEAKKSAGLDVRFHDLRHLAASHLAKAGVSLREIAEVLGHSSLQMVKRYSHFLDDHVIELGDRLAESVFE